MILKNRFLLRKYFLLIFLLSLYACNKPQIKQKSSKSSKCTQENFRLSENVKKVCNHQTLKDLKVSNLESRMNSISLEESQDIYKIPFVIAETNDDCSGYLDLSVLSKKDPSFVKKIKLANNELSALKGLEREGEYRLKARVCNKLGCSQTVSEQELLIKKTTCLTKECRIGKKRIKARLKVKEKIGNLAPKFKEIVSLGEQNLSLLDQPENFNLKDKCDLHKLKQVKAQLADSFKKIKQISSASIAASLQKIDDFYPLLQEELSVEEKKEEEKKEEERKEVLRKAQPILTIATLAGIGIAAITAGIWRSIDSRHLQDEAKKMVAGPTQNALVEMKSVFEKKPKVFQDWWNIDKNKPRKIESFEELSEKEKKQVSKAFLEDQFKSEDLQEFKVGKKRTIDTLSRYLVSPIDNGAQTFLGEIAVAPAPSRAEAQSQKLDVNDFNTLKEGANKLQADYNLRSQSSLKKIERKKRYARAAIGLGSILVAGAIASANLAEDNFVDQFTRFKKEYLSLIEDYDDCSFLSEKELDLIIKEP